ncbi:MAG: hypothetical protein FWC26_03405 [Fibromonadales bacterium]|nr:hypothetical protein [Fibromonadales bacterium]
MKPILSLLALIPALLFAQTADYSWYTSPDAPEYEISTGGQLRGLTDLVNGATTISFSGRTIKLTGDIALSGNWTPIGNVREKPFQGVFDGQKFTISGLAVNGGNYAGLFGYVGASGQIKMVVAAAMVVAVDVAMQEV